MSKKLALQFLLAQKWAIEPSVLSLMGDIATRQFSMADLDKILPDVQALEGQEGRAVTQSMTMREGVAVISINGVISRYSSMFHAMCGGCSASAISTDLNLALNDPNVQGIVLDFDTPGGDVNGIHELGEMIYHARQIKPVIGYVGGSAASAGYWLGSACSELVLDATASVGSIGVIMTVQRSLDEKQHEVLELRSSQSPNKCQTPFDDAGKKSYQAHIDQLADVFIDRVARNLEVDTETVLKEFGGGSVFIGQAAIDKGMAARLGSLEGVIAELQNGKYINMAKEETAAKTDAPGIVAVALPAMSAVNTQALISALTNDRPDVLAALKGEAPITALAAAEDVVKACIAADMPEMSAQLLSAGISKDAALSQIKSAQGLKSVLKVAGLENSFSALSASIDDPIKMVGLAIHEAQAGVDESSTSTQHVTIEETAKEVELNHTDVYASRAVNKV